MTSFATIARLILLIVGAVALLTATYGLVKAQAVVPRELARIPLRLAPGETASARFTPNRPWHYQVMVAYTASGTLDAQGADPAEGLLEWTVTRASTPVASVPARWTPWETATEHMFAVGAFEATRDVAHDLRVRVLRSPTPPIPTNVELVVFLDPVLAKDVAIGRSLRAQLCVLIMVVGGAMVIGALLFLRRHRGVDDVS